MFGWMTSPEAWSALAALTAMEIVLGIDNVVFISVLVSRLPPEQGERARQFGLLLALGLRLALLFTLTAILKLTQPVIIAFGGSLSWRDIILLVGGLFLIVKATHEMHLEMEGGEHLTGGGRKPRGFMSAMVQIAVIDLVFSVDSILTAIGMSRDVPVMVTAVLISMVVMYFAAGPVSVFIRRHPTTKMLALAFLLLVGVVLVMEAFHRDIDRTLIYAAMAFAVFIEAINLKAARGRVKARRRRSTPPPAAVRAARSANDSENPPAA